MCKNATSVCLTCDEFLIALCPLLLSCSMCKGSKYICRNLLSEKSPYLCIWNSNKVLAFFVLFCFNFTMPRVVVTITDFLCKETNKKILKEIALRISVLLGRYRVVTSMFKNVYSCKLFMKNVKQVTPPLF